MVSFIPNLDKIFCKKSLKSLALTAITIFSLGLSLNSASAQTVGPGCDPKFMDAMKQKAWMEAQREIMIAQTTIAKPDTVFALGCFNNFMNGFNGSVSFSENTNYTSIQLPSNINNYVNAAFSGQTLGGGHFSGSNSDFSTCGAMMNLWKAARNANLAQPSPLLGTLNEFSTYKRGNYPTETDAPVGFATPLATFYGAKATGKSVGADFDDMNLFAGVTAPQSQLAAPNKKCAKGIATGVLFDTDRPEVICPNPGCVSDGATTPKCCNYNSDTASCSDTYTAPPK